MSVIDSLEEAWHLPGYNKTDAEILRAAADAVDAGWVQGTFGRTVGDSASAKYQVCAVGGIRTAVLGAPKLSPVHDTVRRAFSQRTGKRVATYPEPMSVQAMTYEEFARSIEYREMEAMRERVLHVEQRVDDWMRQNMHRDNPVSASGVWFLTDYNDADDRTADEVSSLLRRCADAFEQEDSHLVTDLV